jgi:hypothetical protein
MWSATAPAAACCLPGAVMVSLFGDIVGVSFGSNGVSRLHPHPSTRNFSELVLAAP